MSISMRALFTRPEIAAAAGQTEPEIISLRHALANHHGGLALGLGEAHRRFSTPASGDGYARGCHRPTQSVGGDLAYAVPSWVAADDAETRTVEGLLTVSRITNSDFPLRPWHTAYDWNFFVQPDPQYRYLLSPANLDPQAGGDPAGRLECEWDTSAWPQWAWPQDGCRIWMVGRWIYDCGHPHEALGHRAEIHPPRAVATFRREAAHFAGNSGPTRATNAVLYIGRNGGYWRQPINDRDYAFDLYLPPRPYPEAQPRWRVEPRTGDLPVQPRITPYPADNPRALRVVIPLRGAEPHPEEYGAIIAGGWSDPRGSEAAQILRKRVTVARIFMDGDYDNLGDEWHVYVGVNGRWGVWRDIGGDEHALDLTVDLDLHPTDRVQISGCGFEADQLHDYMGDASGFTWEQVSDPALTQAQREAIEDHIFWQLSGSLDDENDAIGYVSWSQPAFWNGTYTLKTGKGDYRLRYTVTDR